MPTATRPRWWGRTARSTGCVSPLRQPLGFARILDPDAGYWSIRPAGGFESSRRYLPGTLAIETTFTAAGGAVGLTDAMLFGGGERGHALGLEAPHELARLVEGLSGRVELVLAPRPEYGLGRPLFALCDGGAFSLGGRAPIEEAACRARARRSRQATELRGPRRARSV